MKTYIVMENLVYILRITRLSAARFEVDVWPRGLPSFEWE